jgi:ubiquinone/menaquinone biosynthesis C-methylase UbiE
LGKFYNRTFVGCDVNFPTPPKAPMLPVIADATALPFSSRSFDAVIVSDVLEHIPPSKRTAVMFEALRVARSVAIFAFPSGTQAFECDRRLSYDYDKAYVGVPPWLQEHMLYSFPKEDLFEEMKSKWSIKSFGNESVKFHYWLMRKEMSRLWSYFFAVLLTIVPRFVEFVLRQADREPFYRRIIVMERIPHLVS